MNEKTKRKKWFENVKMPHTYVTVSYTHLDVYKRQVQVSRLM